MATWGEGAGFRGEGQRGGLRHTAYPSLGMRIQLKFFDVLVFETILRISCRAEVVADYLNVGR